MSGKLIIISAPSGAGKTTLVKHLLENFKQLSFSISCSTRVARENEENGKDYYFIPKLDFLEKIENDEFAEWEEVYEGSYYGTLNSELERIWANQKHVVFDIDVQGGINLKKKFPKKSLSIFIQPPSVEVLEQRLRNRKTESEENLKKRLDKSIYELSFAKEFDKTLVNDDLEDSKQKLAKIVKEFLQK